MEFFTIFTESTVALFLGIISVLFSVYLFRNHRNLRLSTLFSSFAVVTTAYAYVNSSNLTDIYKVFSAMLVVAAFSVSLIRTHHTTRERVIQIVLLMATMFGVATAIVGVNAVAPIVNKEAHQLSTNFIVFGCSFLAATSLSVLVIYSFYRVPGRFEDKEAHVYYHLSIFAFVVISITQIILTYLKL